MIGKSGENMRNSEPKRFSKKVEDFTCGVCGADVSGSGYTDHCPNCLWSRHVDINPGDRASKCGGLMEPMKTEHNRTGFIIEYKCKKCKTRKRMKAADKDNQELLFELLAK